MDRASTISASLLPLSANKRMRERFCTRAAALPVRVSCSSSMRCSSFNWTVCLLLMPSVYHNHQYFVGGVLLAKEAAKLPQVTSFRRIALDDCLLPPDEVEAWIKKQAESDGMPNMCITIPVDDIPMGDYQETRSVILKVRLLRPDGGKSIREISNTMVEIRNRGLAPSSSIHYSPVQEIYELQEVDVPLYDIAPVKVLGRNLLTVSFKSLDYGVPDDSWSRSIPIRADGLLDTLRELGENLYKRFRWDQGQAILFVLTGNTPLVDLMKGEVSITAPFGALSRINLTVDPSVSPSEVEAYYRKLRGSKRRHKRITEKHLTLAIFFATRSDGETWSQMMKAWNEQYSEQDWAYEADDVRNFARDCTSAQKRLLHGYDLL